MIRSIRSLPSLSRLLGESQGSAMPMIALGIFVLVGATGAAIDMGRVQMVQTKLSNSLDAAGLAVGSEVSTSNVQTEAAKYFNVNYPPGFMGSTTQNFSVVTSDNNQIITLSAQEVVPTIFMQMFGVPTVTVNAASEITRQSKGMELVLVMDNTGSMADPAGGSGSKIDAAKSAANTLLNILYGNNNTVQKLWVGLVPFSQAVNIGTSTNVSSWLDTTYDAGLNWGTTSWGGCVEARTNGSSTPQYDISDDPPSVKKFRQYYAPCNTNSNYSNAWYGKNSSHNNCLTGSGLGYKSGLNTTSLGPNLNCPQPVLPMVAEKNTVVTAINNMQAVGSTHIDLGMAWGWRMLSPRWRGLWGGEMSANSMPLDYNTPLMNKVVILMTDGDNTLKGTNSTGTAPSYPSAYTAYGLTGNNWLSVTGSECTSGADCTKGVNEINKRTTAVCNAMKAQGIIIYTIALGTGLDSTSKSLLQGCATSPSYYFLSPTTNELQGIFQQIGDSLANLRISQ